MMKKWSRKYFVFICVALLVVFSNANRVEAWSSGVEEIDGAKFHINMETGELHYYEGPGGKVVIPGEIEGVPVTRIGSYVFYYKGITDIVFPASANSIGEYSFSGNNIRSLVLPDTILSVEVGAFASAGIETLVLSKALEVISTYSFADNKMTTLTIPSGVQTIGVGAFENCNILDIEFPETLESIRSNAFRRNQLSTVVLPTGVVTIGEGAFSHNKIRMASLPESLRFIHRVEYDYENGSTKDVIFEISDEEELQRIFDYQVGHYQSIIHVRSDDDPTIGIETMSSNLLTRVNWLNQSRDKVEGIVTVSDPSGNLVFGQDLIFDGMSIGELEFDLLDYSTIEGGGKVEIIDKNTGALLSNVGVIPFVDYSIDAMKALYERIISYPQEFDLYEIEPSTKAPFSAGKSSEIAIAYSMDYINLCRMLTGVDLVTANAHTHDMAQHASLISHLNGYLSHRPVKPEGMSDELYQKCYEAASANLHMGYYRHYMVRNMIQGFMDDEGPSNIAHVGHRMNIISPRVHQVGVGFVENAGSMHREWDFYRMYPRPTLWPGRSFPIELMRDNTPWSCQFSRDEYPDFDGSKIRVTLENKKSGAKEVFSESYKSNPGGEFYTDSTYGGYNIIFRPASASYREGDAYKVTITGLPGEKSEYSYDVEFVRFTPEPTLILDLNKDGVVNIADVQALYLHVIGIKRLEISTGRADYNADVSLNIGDVQALYLHVIGIKKIQ